MRIAHTPPKEKVIERRLLFTDSIGQKIVVQVETCRRAGKGIVRLLILHGVFLSWTGRFASAAAAIEYAEDWLDKEIARIEKPVFELAQA